MRALRVPLGSIAFLCGQSLVAGCGHQETVEAGALPAFPERSATVHVRGRALLRARARGARELPFPGSNDAYCNECWPHGGPPDPRFEVNEDATLPNVFVEVVGLGKRWRFPVPAARVVVDQLKCLYVPHVAGAMVGQEVVIRNGDRTLHNVSVQSRLNRGFNRTQHYGDEIVTVFKKPDRVLLKCDVHGWMHAQVWVVAHPIFAVTRADGSFELPPLPPGTYEIHAWHENKAWTCDPVRVTLADGKPARVDLEFD